MRLLINDFAGHPFQVQLSRTLAKRGHEVLHCYCASNLSPKGSLEQRDDDPKNFSVRKITIDMPFEKYGLLKRWKQERLIGRALIEVAREFAPDQIICANTPLGTQGVLLRFARASGFPFTYWLQDILSIGIDYHVRRRMPLLGALIGYAFRRYEDLQVLLSDHVVAISSDFLDYLPLPLMRKDAVSVIENWAPIDELPLRPRQNEWSRAHGLDGKLCFLYAGTLGLKHNPHILLQLAERFRDRPETRVVVVSEGMGATYLAAQKQALGLDNLILLPFQKFADMPDVLASADILVSVLEKEAGVFAVPSKVLTYLCVARPLLLAVPSENLSARIVRDIGAGVCVPPDDIEQFISAAQHMADSPLRAEMSRRARDYAERTFNIHDIAMRFEAVLAANAAGRQVTQKARQPAIIPSRV